VRGPIVCLTRRQKKTLRNSAAKLKGAIVITQKPESLSPPQKETPFATSLARCRRRCRAKGDPIPPIAIRKFSPRPLVKRNDFFKQEGGRRDSARFHKPHALLNMTGVGGEKFDIGPIPNAFITGEGYRMIYRLFATWPRRSRIGYHQHDWRQRGRCVQHRRGNPGTEKPDESRHSWRAPRFLGPRHRLDRQWHRQLGPFSKRPARSRSWT